MSVVGGPGYTIYWGDRIVGFAATTGEAATLAAAAFTRSGSTITIVDDNATAVAWIGLEHAPTSTETPLELTAVIDTLNPARFNFTLRGADADADIEFGDEEKLSLPSGQETFSHEYERPNTYHVTASVGEKRAEVYVSAGQVVQNT